MSSACVCHTGEWCFYCEMYVPLEEERDRLRETLEYLKGSRHFALQNYTHMNEYASFLRSVIRSGESLPDDYDYSTFFQKQKYHLREEPQHEKP